MSDTKERILKIAQSEFITRGYSRVKTEELARIMGISKRTLYQHFESKKNLFSVIVKEGLDIERLRSQQIIDRIASGESTDLLDELRNIWETLLKSEMNLSRFFWEDVRKYIPETWNEIINYKEKVMKEHFSVIFNAGVEQGIFCPGINKELIFLIHYNTFKNIFESNIMNEISISFHELMSQFFEIIFLGIMKDRSRETFIDKFRDIDKVKTNLNKLN